MAMAAVLLLHLVNLLKQPVKILSRELCLLNSTPPRLLNPLASRRKCLSTSPGTILMWRLRFQIQTSQSSACGYQPTCMYRFGFCRSSSSSQRLPAPSALLPSRRNRPSTCPGVFHTGRYRFQIQIFQSSAYGQQPNPHTGALLINQGEKRRTKERSASMPTPTHRPSLRFRPIG